MPQARRAAQRTPPRRRSDLFARILVGVPAAVLAIVFVDIGGVGWMLLMAVLAQLIAAIAQLVGVLRSPN